MLERSQKITRGNLAILEEWVAQEPLIDWVKPKSGTVTLLRYDLPIGSHDLCVRLVQEAGVLLTPGSAFGLDGYVRIGFANPTDALMQGLERVSAFLARVKSEG